MTHPLDGAWLKVGRAREHSKLLKTVLDLVVKANPGEVMPERDMPTGDIVIRLHLPNGAFQLPSRLGLIAGDAIHNLRSALDHLAYQLAIIGTGPGRYTQFPIFEDPDKYRDNEDRLLKGIGEGHRAQIKTLQPYHARNFSPQDPLPGLHNPMAINMFLMAIGRLDNIDKHRGLFPSSALVPFKQPKFGGVKWAKGTYPGDVLRVEDGAELYRITSFEMLSGVTNVDVKTPATFGITFGNPEFGPMGTPTDFWSSDDKVMVGHADIAIAADMVEKVMAMFINDF